MMSEHRERFAATIKARRIEKDLRQEDVAEALGLKQPAVSAWERAEAFPAVPTLFALANLLDLNVDELLNPGSEVQGLPAAADESADAGQRRSEPVPAAASAGRSGEPPGSAAHTAIPRGAPAPLSSGLAGKDTGGVTAHLFDGGAQA